MSVNFIMNGKKLYPYIINETNRDRPSLYALFAATFLSVSFLTKCLPFLLRTISPNQSGLRPGDYCVNQLLAITHEIYKSLDEGFEVREFFLKFSKKI